MVKLAPLVAVAFMTATYLNDVAWLDSVLMVAGQLSVNWLLRRSDPGG
jgi:hypothetical protein